MFPLKFTPLNFPGTFALFFICPIYVNQLNDAFAISNICTVVFPFPLFSHTIAITMHTKMSIKSIFRMSAAQEHWLLLLARALAPRNFITIPVNWDFPQAHLSCCLVYKYDAPQDKLCHSDTDTPLTHSPCIK